MVDVSIGGKYLSKIYCEDHENSEEHDSCGPTIDHDRYVIMFSIQTFDICNCWRFQSFWQIKYISLFSQLLAVQVILLGIHDLKNLIQPCDVIFQDSNLLTNNE